MKSYAMRDGRTVAGRRGEHRLKDVASNRRGCFGFVACKVVCLARIAKSPRVLSYRYGPIDHISKRRIDGQA